MKRTIKKVMLIVNMHKTDASELTREIEEYLEGKGIETVVVGFLGKPENPDVKDVDFVFSLGGDGTVLYCARIVESTGIPILALNLGNFGFITEISKHEWKSAFERFEKGEACLSRRIMLKVVVERGGRKIASFKGLNDAVISPEGISTIVKLRLMINNTHLGEYRADGVIVATPTGSTAYSVSAGGPILEPEMEAIIVNPICPFTLSNRPIVMSGDEVISIFVEKDQRVGVILSIDGQESFPLYPDDRIIIEKSRSKTLLVRSDVRNFYEILRSKLNWSGGPDA